ncbi:MAG: hypothetical protein KGY80_11740 [Candidatus Thorarchaeota archaeon]|nr:hypothetical protein [Candidatus Thorarchaeota archaeon]
MEQISEDQDITPIEPIEDNYLLSWRFGPLTILDIILSVSYTSSILFYLLNGSRLDVYLWGNQLTGVEGAFVYFSSALGGFLVGIYFLHRLKKDLMKQELTPLSIARMFLVLSPPYFLFSMSIGFILGRVQTAWYTSDWTMLLYGPGLGLLAARLLYFIHESRFWKFEPVLSEKRSRFRDVDHYLASRQ